MKQIEDELLINAAKWHKNHYGQREVSVSVFCTFLCGHLHSYEKAVKPSVEKMVSMGLIEVKNEKVKVQ